MKIAQKFLTGVVAMSALMPLALLPIQAQAQQYQTQQYNTQRSAPRIEGFNVNEVRRLNPGVELNFDLYGTPGGSASLRIDGATRTVAMTEVDAGHYEGAYTINSRDQIVANSPVTANLRVGNQVASAVLTESLQSVAGARRAQAMASRNLKIERFSVVPAADLNRGQELEFTVLGTPGAKVNLVIDGVRGKILLDEVSSGTYTGTYTIRGRDRIAPNSVVTANLVMNERTTSSVLGQSLQNAAAPAPARAARICQTCGTVEAVNLVEVKGEGGLIGLIGGGVVGGLLGNQVGGGNGKKLATVAGAVGGAYAGREIEARTRKASHYEVVVRMQHGATQTVVSPTEPGYRVGEKVQINDGVITRTQ